MAAAKDEKKLTKKEAVRQALKEVGKTAKADVVLEHIKTKHGMEISQAHYFNIKSTLKNRRGRRARLQTAAAENGQRTATLRPAATRENISLEALDTLKQMVGRYGAANLHHLVDVLAR